ncbi:LysR family transcriptional regulator [Sporolactobacillus pectinivorans]|uniref:LysR family transcriptional regulator n=1 Tax=Sporolactobacillus pectinivorans TaxID=1591408 RepID=UPI000C26480A|nr:LysR family transcriptional regulator [Sporolactobacillus pectinivorans]
MDYRDWIILQRLYEKKNMTQTAQSLYISQPTLSHRLQQIEKEFGVTIVNRGRRGVQFTPQGEYLAGIADRVLNVIRTAKEHVADMSEDVVGTLSIGVSDSFTYHKLPLVLKRFKDHYPKVEFKVVTHRSGDILQRVYRQEVYIGIIRGHYHWKGEKSLLFSEKLCLISKDKIKMDKLPELPRIDYHSDYELRASVDDWWAKHFSEPPRVSIEVDKADMCKEMVLSGLGYAIVPSLIISPEDQLESVDLLNGNGEPILRETWLIYFKEMLTLNVVRAFVDFIVSPGALDE